MTLSRDDFTEQQIGQALQVIRKQQGFTQQYIADYIDVARTTIVAIENGDRRIRDDELWWLMELYQQTPESLMMAIQKITIVNQKIPKTYQYAASNQDFGDWLLAQEEFLEIGSGL